MEMDVIVENEVVPETGWIFGLRHFNEEEAEEDKGPPTVTWLATAIDLDRKQRERERERERERFLARLLMSLSVQARNVAAYFPHLHKTTRLETC